jgi:hypothetical protein
MLSARRLLAPVLAAALALAPLGATAQTPPALRQDLEAVAAALDRAVREVSRPGAFVFAGPATRAYALPGVGAMFVLPPRALPLPAARTATDRQAARALAEALANLQDSLERARTPELREQIERSLQAVRQAQAELRGPRPPVRKGPVVVDVLPPGEAAVEVEVEVEREEGHRARALREARQAERDAARDIERQWEAHMRAFNAQTDAFAREAERMRQEAERALRDQLRNAWPELAEPPPAPEPPATPAAVAAPAPPARAAAPVVPGASAVPPAPALPPPPPWSLWLELDESADAADADSVVAAVRTAVLGVLEAQAVRLARLAPGESAVVAVDFVPRHARAGVPRTLVWRVRNKDLEERARGRLGAEEFRRRVLVSEY